MYRFCALNEKKIDTLMGRPLTCAARGNHPPPSSLRRRIFLRVCKTAKADDIW